MNKAAIATIATLATVVDFGALLPSRPRFDCPKCKRACLQGKEALRYCLRCAYTEAKP